jgi:hypothetical protein
VEASRSIQAFYIAGRNQPLVWIAYDHDLFRADHVGCAITPIFAVISGSVDLDDLSVIDFAAKGVLYCSYIGR